MKSSGLWNRLNIGQKYAFVSTFIIGVLTHGMMLFNKYSFHDDLICIFQGGATFSSGRWMLFVAEKIKNLIFQDSLYSIPAFNGIFTFFCIAVSSCLLIDLFEIRSKYFSVLLSGIMVTIPVVTCMFGYMFTAQYFALSILMAVLGSYLVLKKKQWYFIAAGIVLMACSVGIYQAYIPTMLSILMFGLFMMFSRADTTEKRQEALKKTLVVIVSCIAFMALYALILFACLKITGTQLSSYNGIDTSYKMPLSVYLQRALEAYREFFVLSRTSHFNVFPGLAYTMYEIMAFLFVFLLIRQTILSFRINKINGIFLLLFTLLSPLCINFIFVMVKRSGIYAMTAYSYTILIAFFLYLVEECISSAESRFSRFSAAALYIGLGLMVVIFSRYDSACYTRLEFSQKQTYRYYTSLVTRMQSAPGYRMDMRVAYVGENRWVPWDPTVSQESAFDFINTHPFWGLRANIGNSYKKYMELWFDFKPREADSSYFYDLPEVQAMPSYPDDGSIKVIDDVLVVKFWP